MNPIEATTRAALAAFVAAFGRVPDDQEAVLLALAVSDFYGLERPDQWRH